MGDGPKRYDKPYKAPVFKIIESNSLKDGPELFGALPGIPPPAEPSVPTLEERQDLNPEGYDPDEDYLSRDPDHIHLDIQTRVVPPPDQDADLLPEGTEMPVMLAMPTMAGAIPMPEPLREPGPKPTKVVHLEQGIRNWDVEFTATPFAGGDRVNIKMVMTRKIYPRPRGSPKMARQESVEQLSLEKEGARSLMNFLQDWLDGEEPSSA